MASDSEPESSSLKVMKAYKCLDLLDNDGGLLVFGLAFSIGHKCQRDLDVEGPGKDGEEDVKDLLTRRSLGHTFPTKHAHNSGNDLLPPPLYFLLLVFSKTAL